MRSPRIPAWAWLGLIAILLFDVWWRGHTVGPSVRAATGLTLWPVVRGDAEPLDCDEAAYAYIGRRIVAGDVLYRDLTENKPPAGYWIYTLAVALGGANELAIRLMPIPMVLATIALIWWIALRVRGPGAACLAAGVYAIASTDPYLFGNGANLEHAINLFSVLSLALMVAWPGDRQRAFLVGAGAAVGLASLVKQVALLTLPVYAMAVLFSRGGRRRGFDLLSLLAGFALVWLLAIGVLAAQHAGPDAYEDIVRYGGALATDTPPADHAPPFLVRWITGNADPRDGRLPPPFGTTDYYVWWGAGSWPLWLAAIPALGWLLAVDGAGGRRRLIAGWTLAAWVEVAAPRLFWQHYYLLPVPGLALATAIALADALERRICARSQGLRAAWLVTSIALAAALLATLAIQVRAYLLVPPEELTARYKGGKQWITLRTAGRDLRRRSKVWRDPHLFIWGWQSPLLIYGDMDSVTPHFFADPLLKAFAGKRHPLIEPRTERILADLRRKRPELILAADPPFPGLREFLYRNYLRSGLFPQGSNGVGLWVEPGGYAAFEKGSPPDAGDARESPGARGRDVRRRPAPGLGSGDSALEARP